MNRDAFRGDGHADRIDEERHIVIDDLDNGAMRDRAEFAGARGEHAQLCFARHTLLRELP